MEDVPYWTGIKTQMLRLVDGWFVVRCSHPYKNTRMVEVKTTLGHQHGSMTLRCQNMYYRISKIVITTSITM